MDAAGNEQEVAGRIHDPGLAWGENVDAEITERCDIIRDLSHVSAEASGDGGADPIPLRSIASLSVT